MKKLAFLIAIFALSFDLLQAKVLNTDMDYSLYRESQHFIFDIPDSYLVGNITPENLGQWMQHMDDVYEAYTNLVGHTPCDGQKLTFVASEDRFGWLWVFGNHPYIYWNNELIASDMKRINDSGSWFFGALHEIGHLFDKESEPNWFFHPEITANLKAIYALDVIPDCNYNELDGHKDSLQDIYDHFYGYSVQDEGEDDRYTDKITLGFIKIAQRYGWNVFTQTFNSYWDNSYPNAGCNIGGAGKYNEFIDRLEYFSGSADIRSECFSTNNWLATIEQHYPQNAIPTWQIGSPNAVDVTASFNCNTGTLTISGTGAMQDWISSQAPWFGDQDNITSVVIQNGVTNLGTRAFAYCSNLTSITIPNSVTTIGEWCFSTSGLTSITVPESVSSLKEGVFDRCYSLQSITIPSSITSIEKWAFAHCTGLKSITNNATIPQSILPSNERDEGAFQWVNIQNISLHVPSGTQCLYAVAPVWKDFNIEGAQFTITASASNGGSISSPNGTQTVQCGEDKRFDFSPDNSCYEIDQVLVDGVANAKAKADGYYIFPNVTENHTISVTFTQKQFTISSSANTGGTITASATVNCGSSKTFTFLPDPDYEIQSVLIDEIPDEAAKIKRYYTFLDIADNHTIKVNFQKKYTDIGKVYISQISIYPNPAKDEIFIQSDLEIQRINILDLSGRTVETRYATPLPNGVQTISVSSLPKGVYLVKIYAGSEIIVRKIVKE